jgi:hypothetical protein
VEDGHLQEGLDDTDEYIEIERYDRADHVDVSRTWGPVDSASTHTAVTALGAGGAVQRRNLDARSRDGCIRVAKMEIRG